MERIGEGLIWGTDSAGVRAWANTAPAEPENVGDMVHVRSFIRVVLEKLQTDQQEREGQTAEER